MRNSVHDLAETKEEGDQSVGVGDVGRWTEGDVDGAIGCKVLVILVER